MSREKIREGIARQVWCCGINLEMARRGEPVRYFLAEFEEQCLIDKQPYYEAADEILREESEQGVVLKVERELSKNPLDEAEPIDGTRRLYQLGDFAFDELYKQAYGSGFRFCREKMAGYVAVEPLIEEL